MMRCKNFVNLCDLLLSRCVGVAWRTLLVYTSVTPCLKGHAPGAKLLRVYQRFHGHSSSSGAKFPPRKMLHDIFGSKLRGQIERTWKRSLVCTDTCKMRLEHAPGANPFCVSAFMYDSRSRKGIVFVPKQGKKTCKDTD